MLPMTGVDGSFLNLETPQTPMHVGSLHLFEVPDGDVAGFHPMLVRHIAARLDRVPVFRRRLAPMPLQFANPVWVDDDGVDLDHHIRRVVLPAPGTREQLFRAAADLHSTLMDRSRPLWMIYVFEGLASGEVAYYIKVHHAVLDGQAGVLLAQALFDVTATPRAVPRPGRGVAAEHPGMGELAAAALKHDAAQIVKFVRHLPDVVGTLAGLLGGRGGSSGGGAKPSAGMGQNFGFGPRTPLNVSITGERSFAGLSLPLDALKQLAAAHDAKLNDIVLALCSGALRRYLARHGGIPKKPLVAAMPISLRASGNTEFSTQATMTLVNLHTHRADAVRRLHAIRDAAGAAKALAGRTRSILPTDFPSITVPWVLHGLATLYGRSGLAGTIPPIANLIVSNVPGPQVPLYAAGARLRTYWPLSIPEHGLGLNITVMSYAGAMGFGFTAARVAVPDARPLARALAEAFDELVTKSTPRAARKTPPRKSAPRKGAPRKGATKAATKAAATPGRGARR